MFARIAFAVPFGAAVTAALLYMMHLFIATGHGQIDEPATRIFDFVRVERSEVIQEKETRPERPAEPERAPDFPQPEFATDFSASLAVAPAEPGFEIAVRAHGFGLSGGDGEYLPIVKVAPTYPMRALQRRLEGYVIVEFVVTASGGVRDVAVIESSAEVFEQAAIEAALKFRYKPRVVDGAAIAVRGVRNRITFKLDA